MSRGDGGIMESWPRDHCFLYLTFSCQRPSRVFNLFSSVFSLTGWRYQDAGDNEAGSWVSSEFLCRQPAESGSAPQTHKPVSKPRGKTGGLSGTLCWEEDRGGWKQEEKRTACSFAVVATGTCYDATFILMGNILISSQEDVNTLWEKKVEGGRKWW